MTGLEQAAENSIKRVIPRHARAQVSLFFLTFKMRKIPRFAWNDNQRDFFRIL